MPSISDGSGVSLEARNISKNSLRGQDFRKVTASAAEGAGSTGGLSGATVV